MKVFIVEKNQWKVKKMKKALEFLFPVVNVEKVVSGFPSLSSLGDMSDQPELILVDPLQSEFLQEKDMHTRLVIETPEYEISYIALPARQLTNEAALAISCEGDILEDGDIISEEEAQAFNTAAPQKRELAAYKERFLVEKGKRIFSVPVEAIAYFFSNQRLIFFVTITNQKYATSYRIEELEQMLNPEHFFRINRSFIISIFSIEQIVSQAGGRYKVKLAPSSEEEVFVSRSRLKDFRTWLGA